MVLFSVQRFASGATVDTNVDDVGQLISISESSAAPSGRGRGNTLVRVNSVNLDN